MSEQAPTKKKLFCWQCGRSLNYVKGAPMFELVTLPGGNQVKVHKVCKQGAINYQTFDNTPPPGSYEPIKRGSLELEEAWERA